MVVVGYLIVTGLILAGNWCMWLRLVKHTTNRGSRGRRIGSALLVTTAVLLIAALLGPHLWPVQLGLAAWPGFLWLAFMLYFTVGILLIDLVLLPVRLRWWRGSKNSTGPGAATPNSRRIFLARAAAAVAGVAAGTAVGAGVRSALGAPVTRRIPVTLPKLPTSRDGFTIAFAADLHLGPILGREHTERVVDALNDCDADVVAIIGDLADGSVSDLGPAAGPLRRLRARHGVFFTIGNHDYFSGHREWADQLAALGLRVLRNERVSLDGIDLAGVNDVSGNWFADPANLTSAFAGRDRSRPIVVLAHSPVQAAEAARHGADLMLSGHTHDGQMWPLKYLVGLQQPVTAGLGQVGGMPVCVTRGAGFWGPPVRLGAPPDVTLVVLRSPS